MKTRRKAKSLTKKKTASREKQSEETATSIATQTSERLGEILSDLTKKVQAIGAHCVFCFSIDEAEYGKKHFIACTGTGERLAKLNVAIGSHIFKAVVASQGEK